MLGCSVKFWVMDYDSISDKFTIQNSTVFILQEKSMEEMLEVQNMVSKLAGGHMIRELLDNCLLPVKDEAITVEPAIIKTEKEEDSDEEVAKEENTEVADTDSLDNLETNITVVDGNLKCSFCNRRFKFEKSLDKHEELHKIDPNSPSLKQRKVPKNNRLKGDRMPRGNYQCDKCTSCFKMYTALQRHIEAHDLACKMSQQETEGKDETNSRRKCVTCDLAWPTEGMFKLHMQKYHEKAISCEECNKTFTLPSALERHMLNYHTSFPKNCEECVVLCITKIDYKKHIETVHNQNAREPEAPCEICGKLLKNKYVLKQHVKLAHDKIYQSFPCDKCGKILKSKSSLEYHYRVHTGDEPFRCDECGRGYRRLERMMACKSNHRGIYQYNCKDCSYKTNKLGHYKNHITTHSGEKPLTCPLCGHPSSTPTNLSGHCKKVHKISLCEAEALTRKDRWGRQMNEEDMEKNAQKLEKNMQVRETRMMSQM